MDLQMPEMDGFQATTKIRADDRFAELPIVAMTAHATIEERQRCLMSGMNDHVAKPIDPAALYDTVRRFCRVEAVSEERTPSAQASPSAVDVPEIDGIDTTNGLRRVAGNRKLYLSLIRRFCEQQAMVPAEIVDCLNRDDTSTAERLAHTLKGVSGNIGAGDVQAKAAAVESAIREEQPAAVVLELVADARQSLERAIAAIQALVPQEEDATRPVAALDWDLVRPRIARLELLLSDDDAEASELFTESQDLLAAGLGSASGPIRECLRNYDFEAALALLREAKARIPDLN
jgi:CheY-like chemotaxis protein